MFDKIKVKIAMFQAKRVMKKMGFSKQTIRRWEYGIDYPYELELYKIIQLDRQRREMLQKYKPTTITIDKKAYVVKPKKQEKDWLDSTDKEPEDLVSGDR